MSEIRKALTASGDGAALAVVDLDPVLHEELLKLQPLAMVMGVEQAEGMTHEYKVRTSHPQGWFEGEVTAANAQNSAYERKSVQLKIQRIWGGVSGFSRAVSQKFVDSLAAETEGSVQGMGELMEYGALFGTANDIGFTGDAYQYSGILPRVYAYAASTNVIDAGGDKITLDDLDAAYAAINKFRGVRNDPQMWFMGMRMKQVVDGLQTKVQLPLRSAELFDGKLTMGAYAGAPIFESDFVVPASTTTSPACTAVKAAGGSLADATYTYQISSVTMYGEQVAGTASSGVTTETTNNKVNLTWTHDDNARLYMIWRKIGSGSYQLLDIIPAYTYNADGSVSGNKEAYTDDGTRTALAVKPLASGEQIIVISNLRPGRGASWVAARDDMGYVVSAEGVVSGLLSFVELARTKDSFDYLLKSYQALKMPHPNLAAVIRHVKLS
jgi:hypothetical protein